jgi:acyl-coenzyme A synthetase/AMP-(fatty) acid ligase
VRISGRRSQRLNLAGRKVDPAEVEAVLRDFPGVAGAAVTVSGGHDPCLCALIQGPRLPDVPALRRHLASHLSSYKIPQRYLRVDQLPVTASGKLIRHALADLIPPDKGERP